jgi:hypothetical protein
MATFGGSILSAVILLTGLAGNMFLCYPGWIWLWYLPVDLPIPIFQSPTGAQHISAARREIGATPGR